jgi:hypothetical protein
MKVLVATKKTQGFRNNDFSWADEGEYVGFAFECDGEVVDGTCGCRRSFTGLGSHKATTTAEVAEKKITEAEYVALYRISNVRAGWIKPGEEVAWVRTHVHRLMEIALRYPVGAIVEKRGISCGRRVVKEAT